MHVFKKNSNIFHLLAESVAEGILVVNQELNIVSVNRHTLTLFNYKEEELLGKPLTQILPEKNEQVYKTFIAAKPVERQHFINNGIQTQVGLTKSGIEIPIDISFNSFNLSDRHYFLALIFDLSEKRKRLTDLQINTTAMDSALNGITISDTLKEDNPIIYANKSFEKITGYSQKEILHRNCRFLQNDDTHQLGIEEMRSAIHKGQSCRVVLRNYKKNGQMFWNEISLSPIKNEDGVLTHFVAIQNDITKRIITEQRNRQLIRIFNESDNEIYVFDGQTLRYKNVNFGARKNTGYSLKNFMKMSPLDLEPAFTERQFRNLLAPILKSAGKKIEYESSHQRKNGSTYPVEVHLQSTKVGEQCLISAVVFDVTDKKEYTQKLEKTVSERTRQLKSALLKEKELNDLKSKFLAMVSHEFKTPLSSILTSATLVGKYTNSDTQNKREKHLNTIVSGVHHLTGILNDFLSMERLEKGDDLYKFTDFSLSKVINEVLYNANMMLKTGQRINYPMNIEDVSICQDEKIVELTLTNLLNNAIKYSPERTEIDLLVTVTKHTATFDVVDRGLGIPEEDKKHIFERYFRAANILTTQGTGIGLYIIKSHIQHLGGQVTFISKQNKGSTFTVVLPIEEAFCEDRG